MMCSLLRSRGQKKSLIVVAVSSPYDFAMDKQIGTYICTFDFTETAMKALVRALLGEFTPQGTLPGSLRKSKKVLKPRQHWLVEEYDRERDANGLEELIKAVVRGSASEYKFLETATAASFELFNPLIQEAHFVVRNSSTHALYGFAATYFVGGNGILGSIFIDPGKRNLSIGRSLHRRAIRSLIQWPNCKRLQLGTGFPGIFLGLPIDQSSNETKKWFKNSGWDTEFPRRLTNLTISNLSNWAAPDGLLQSIQRANLRFDLVQGLENGAVVLNHVKAHADPEVLELYTLALQDASCGIVRVKGPSDALLGTVIECRQSSALATFIPALKGPSKDGDDISGIIAPVIAAATPQATLILQGLALMGIRRNKARKATKTVLSWVSCVSTPRRVVDINRLNLPGP
jgi:beta-N-acetylhexosaminidase